MVCAAPSYLAQHDKPKVPSDLEHHNCLLMRFGDGPDNQWRFRVDGKEVRVSVRGNRIANDGDLVRRWCVDGHGVALKSKADLEAGRLVPLLSEFELEPSELQLVYVGGRPPARRVRALIEHVVEARGSLVPLPRSNR